MPNSICHTCGSDYAWTWEEAFNKFGFNDGDHMVMTEDVACVLATAGFEVKCNSWGWHNTVIDSIRKAGVELIPHDRITFGYDNPRDYLSAEIVALLDAKLPAHEEVPS